MPRLFTGLEIPQRVGQQLALLRGGLPGARWLDGDLFHLTLRFIGDVDGRVAKDIDDLLSQIRRRRFDLELSGVACLGSRLNRAIVVSATPVPALIDLQAEQERIFQRLGLPADPRRYQPHVTLARLSGVETVDIAAYLGLRGGFAVPAFPVETFRLYSARPRVGGGPYVVERDYSLI